MNWNVQNSYKKRCINKNDYLYMLSGLDLLNQYDKNKKENKTNKATNIGKEYFEKVHNDSWYDTTNIQKEKDVYLFTRECNIDNIDDTKEENNILCSEDFNLINIDKNGCLNYLMNIQKEFKNNSYFNQLSKKNKHDALLKFRSLSGKDSSIFQKNKKNKLEKSNNLKKKKNPKSCNININKILEKNDTNINLSSEKLKIKESMVEKNIKYLKNKYNKDNYTFENIDIEKINEIDNKEENLNDCFIENNISNEKGNKLLQNVNRELNKTVYSDNNLEKFNYVCDDIETKNIFLKENENNINYKENNIFKNINTLKNGKKIYNIKNADFALKRYASEMNSNKKKNDIKNMYGYKNYFMQKNINNNLTKEYELLNMQKYNLFNFENINENDINLYKENKINEENQNKTDILTCDKLEDDCITENIYNINMQELYSNKSFLKKDAFFSIDFTIYKSIFIKKITQISIYLETKLIKNIYINDFPQHFSVIIQSLIKINTESAYIKIKKKLIHIKDTNILKFVLINNDNEIGCAYISLKNLFFLGKESDIFININNDKNMDNKINKNKHMELIDSNIFPLHNNKINLFSPKIFLNYKISCSKFIHDTISLSDIIKTKDKINILEKLIIDIYEFLETSNFLNNVRYGKSRIPVNEYYKKENIKHKENIKNENNEIKEIKEFSSKNKLEHLNLNNIKNNNIYKEEKEKEVKEENEKEKEKKENEKEQEKEENEKEKGEEEEEEEEKKNDKIENKKIDKNNEQLNYISENLHKTNEYINQIELDELKNKEKLNETNEKYVNDIENETNINNNEEFEDCINSYEKDKDNINNIEKNEDYINNNEKNEDYIINNEKNEDYINNNEENENNINNNEKNENHINNNEKNEDNINNNEKNENHINNNEKNENYINNNEENEDNINNNKNNEKKNKNNKVNENIKKENINVNKTNINNTDNINKHLKVNLNYYNNNEQKYKKTIENLKKIIEENEKEMKKKEKKIEHLKHAYNNLNILYKSNKKVNDMNSNNIFKNNISSNIINDYNMIQKNRMKNVAKLNEIVKNNKCIIYKYSPTKKCDKIKHFPNLYTNENDNILKDELITDNLENVNKLNVKKNEINCILKTSKLNIIKKHRISNVFREYNKHNLIKLFDTTDMIQSNRKKYIHTLHKNNETNNENNEINEEIQTNFNVYKKTKQKNNLNIEKKLQKKEKILNDNILLIEKTYTSQQDNKYKKNNSSDKKKLLDNSKSSSDDNKRTKSFRNDTRFNLPCNLITE